MFLLSILDFECLVNVLAFTDCVAVRVLLANLVPVYTCCLVPVSTTCLVADKVLLGWNTLGMVYDCV